MYGTRASQQHHRHHTDWTQLFKIHLRPICLVKHLENDTCPTRHFVGSFALGTAVQPPGTLNCCR